MTTRTVRTGKPRRAALLAVLLIAVGGIAACASDQSSPPADPTPVTVVASQATVLHLDGGANLIIPPGAMTNGATVHATYRGQPSGTWPDLQPTTAPVELISNPPNAIHGLLTLEFPVSPAKLPPGVDPANAYGISTYDATSQTWTPFTSTYDAARQMVVAEIPHFSWWNPFSWDWAGIAARVNQDVGQALGKRASPPTCSGGPPSWVGATAGVTTDAAIAIRSCTQAQGDVLDVEIVNNRTYGMVLTYGAPVKWGWHAPGTSAVAQARNAIADQLLQPNQLYLPPLSKASVGIFPTQPGSNSVFNIGVTWASLLPDIGVEIAGELLPKIPKIGSCGFWLANSSLGSVSVSSLRDKFVSAGSCLVSSYMAEIQSGRLDQVAVAQLQATLAALKSASIIGKAWSVAGYIWRSADALADAIVASDSGALGAGFSVYAHADLAAPATPTNPSGTSGTATPGTGSVGQSPVTPSQPPVQAPPPPPPPATYAETVGGQAHTWTDYANAGGTEGPTIPAYASVQISCKLQGFAVQDGNTWWYRIASSPWNDQYYVSADAFYNNGRTSGSLHGTPFMDPAVPGC